MSTPETLTAAPGTPSPPESVTVPEIEPVSPAQAAVVATRSTSERSVRDMSLIPNLLLKQMKTGQSFYHERAALIEYSEAIQFVGGHRHVGSTLAFPVRGTRFGPDRGASGVAPRGAARVWRRMNRGLERIQSYPFQKLAALLQGV